MERFVWIRKGLGCAAKLWCCFPYFDDCCDAVIRPLTERFKKLRYNTWARFRWEIQASKATVNRWGATVMNLMKEAERAGLVPTLTEEQHILCIKYNDTSDTFLCHDSLRSTIRNSR